MLGAGLAGPRLGLTTRAERAYAVTVIAGVGGWLAAATLSGPGREPLPRLLLVGALCSRCPGGRTGGAAPGSASSAARRLARDRPGGRAGRLAGHVGRGGRVGLAGPVRAGPRPDDHRRDRASCPRSSPRWAPSAARSASIRPPTTWPTGSSCGCWTATRTPTRSPGPGPSVASITEPVELGPFEDATPCRVLLLRRHGAHRRCDRLGQERRPQRAHGQPDRLPRRGHLGHRPQARHGTRPLGLRASTGWRSRRPRPAPCSPTRSRSWRPAPR